MKPNRFEFIQNIKPKTMLMVLGQYALGVAIVYSLIRFGYKIDFSSINTIIFSPAIALLIGLKAISLIFSSCRWFVLLKTLQIKRPVSEVFRCSMIGFALSYIIPGAVSGDVAKVYLLKSKSESTKKIILSIFLDRVFGLMIILLFIVFALIYTYFQQPQFLHSLKTALAIDTNTLITGTVILAGIGSIGLFLLFKKRHLWLTALETKNITLQVLLKCLGLSLLAHMTYILFLYKTASLMGYHAVDPIGLALCYSLAALIIVIPITPGGLGVGQTVYAVLFKWYFIDNLQNLGASLFTISQVADFSLALLGILWLSLHYMKKWQKRKILPSLKKS